MVVWAPVEQFLPEVCSKGGILVRESVVADLRWCTRFLCLLHLLSLSTPLGTLSALCQSWRWERIEVETDLALDGGARTTLDAGEGCIICPFSSTIGMWLPDHGLGAGEAFPRSLVRR